jgi:fructose-1,6-bisphosphatase/inositol monophosphatase family enzyme
MRHIYLIIAKQIVEEAARIIREARETNTYGITFKEDGTPVTDIDQQVQDYMSIRLKDSCHVQVMGEENCEEIDTSKPYWAIDPIDGTWSFIGQENTTAINLSYVEDNEVLLGIVCNPFTNEFFYTQKGTRSFMGVMPLPLKENPHVEVVNIKPEREHPIVKSCNILFKEDKIKKLTSIGGSIAYSMCMVIKGACSNYIAYYKHQINAWDLSASILIIRNAGGFVTDLEGLDVDPINHQGYIVASANAVCRDEFLEMIKPLIQSMESN